MQSSKHEEITLAYELIFFFILYFVGATLSKKYCQKWGVCEKNIEGTLSIEGEFNSSAHCGMDEINFVVINVKSSSE